MVELGPRNFARELPPIPDGLKMVPIPLVCSPQCRGYWHTGYIRLVMVASLSPPQLPEISPQIVQDFGYSEPGVTDSELIYSS